MKKSNVVASFDWISLCMFFGSFIASLMLNFIFIYYISNAEIEYKKCQNTVNSLYGTDLDGMNESENNATEFNN